MTNYVVQKEHQALRNEIEDLKNKLQKVSDDLTKNQQGQHSTHSFLRCALTRLHLSGKSF